MSVVTDYFRAVVKLESFGDGRKAGPSHTHSLAGFEYAATNTYVTEWAHSYEDAQQLGQVKAEAMLELLPPDARNQWENDPPSVHITIEKITEVSL